MSLKDVFRRLSSPSRESRVRFSFIDDSELVGEDDFCQQPGNQSRYICLPENCKVKKKEERNRRKISLNRVDNIPKTYMWRKACADVTITRAELNNVLSHLELPPSNYKSMKSFPLVLAYYEQPDISTCRANDYLESYVFPTLLPTIKALMDFVLEKRILQCRRSTFNALDYLSERLYNRNPLHPERHEKPTPLLEIGFTEKWLTKYPRPKLPKWLRMPADTAALVIQRFYRGYVVRKRDDVQEMRQFWRDYKLDQMEEAQHKPKRKKTEEEAIIVLQHAFRNYLARKADHETTDQEEEEQEGGDKIKVGSSELGSQMGKEYELDSDSDELTTAHKTHSEDCQICARFKKMVCKNINKDVPPEGVPSVSFNPKVTSSTKLKKSPSKKKKGKSKSKTPSSEKLSKKSKKGKLAKANSREKLSKKSSKEKLSENEKPLETVSKKSVDDEPPFASRYDYCCFHPEGRLPFTHHTSSQNLVVPRRPPVTAITPISKCKSDSIVAPPQPSPEYKLQRTSISEKLFPIPVRPSVEHDNYKNCHQACQDKISLPKVQVYDSRPFLPCDGVPKIPKVPPPPPSLIDTKQV